MSSSSSSTTTTTVEPTSEEAKTIVVDVPPPPPTTTTTTTTTTPPPDTGENSNSASDNSNHDDKDDGDGACDSGSSNTSKEKKTAAATTSEKNNPKSLNRKNSSSTSETSNNNKPPITKKKQLKSDKRELTKKLKAKNREHKVQQQQGEQMLNDVLLELDRERATRAELEAKVRILEQDVYTARKELQQHKNPKSTTMANGGTQSIPIPTTREFIKLQTEKDGYLQLLDALLQDRPAFQNSSSTKEGDDSSEESKQTLPLHVLRMMEIIPWDPRARPHLFGLEELYEWQIYSSDKTWRKEIRHFPKDVQFRQMSWIIAQPNQTVNEAPTSSSPPRGQNCVLTNLEITRLLNIDNGYPLPKDGGVWKWVGSWRIEKNQNTDKLGWSYSNSITINDDNSYYGELRMPKPGQPNLLKRRRKWTRLRVLVDYPNASESTQQYLKLVAQNAELDVSVEKLSSQLVETKMNLTTLEADHLTLKEDTDLKIRSLQRDLTDKKRIIQTLERDAGIDHNNLPAPTNKAKESVNELKNAVTQWVANTVAQQTNKQKQDNDHDHDSSNRSNAEDKNEKMNNKTKGDEELTSSSRTTKPAPESINSYSTSKQGGSNTSSGSGGGGSNNDSKQQHVVFVESLKEKGGDILGKGGDLFEKFKKKVGGGEEDLIEKLKQSNKNFHNLKDMLSPNKNDTNKNDNNNEEKKQAATTTATTTTNDGADDGAKADGSEQKSGVAHGVGGSDQQQSTTASATSNIQSSNSNSPFNDDEPIPKKSNNPFDD